MKNLFYSIALGLASFTSFAQPTNSTILNWMNVGKMPGVSIVVIKEGKWIYSNNLGHADISTSKPVDGQTIFMQASVSKTMTATAVMQLWEKGLINLDADVNNYLPFPVRTPSFPNDSITARMLLTHTSAIKDDWNTMGNLYVFGDSPVPLDSFMKNYFMPTGIFYGAGNFYNYQPGTQKNYSNIGSTLAAFLVESITGDKFSHYCDTAIFQKICMGSTSFLLSGIADTTRIARPYYWDNGMYNDAGLYGYPDYPDGQLRTTSTDMARFMTMYMQYGVYEGTRLLDSATVDYMLQQQTPVDPEQGIIFYSSPSSNNDILWGHNGGDVGVNTALYFNKAKKTGVIVLTNGEGGQGISADYIVEHFYLYGIGVTPGVNDTFPACGSITSVPDITTLLNETVIYPNPSSGQLNVEMPVDGYISVYDVQGRVVLSQELHKSVNQVVLPVTCPSGIYMLKITDKNKKVNAVKRITIVR